MGAEKPLPIPLGFIFYEYRADYKKQDNGKVHNFTE